MLNIAEMNWFYYISNFTDIRCKYSRVLAVIRHLLGREPELEELIYNINWKEDSRRSHRRNRA